MGLIRGLPVTVAGSMLLLAVAGHAAAPAGKPPVGAAKPVAMTQALASDAGMDRVVALCSRCHTPKNVIGQHHDEDGWGTVLDRMEGHGVKFSDEDYATITRYLAKHY